jgi:periplasmic divalent cation tolerance protein
VKRKDSIDFRRSPVPRNNGAFIVLVTCSSTGEAKKIARSAVARRFAACGNILPSVQSIYRWKGKIESARECLLILKTTNRALAGLEAEVKRLHSYDLPEFIAIAVAAGSPGYLAWISSNVA